MRGKANHVRWLLVMLFITLPVQAKYGGGSGTAEDPYLIYTAEQMNTIGSEPNDWDKHFRLVADIDLKDFGGSSFSLIGSYSHPFKGVFDGNGHTISNLTYVVTGNEELTDDAWITSFGLFRYIDDPNALIKDLNLVNPDIRPASTCQKWLWIVGALSGSLGSGSISNCSIEGGQVQGERMAGGLAGSNSGTISDCYTTCTVGPAEQRSLTPIDDGMDKRESFGGLVGTNGGEISNCHTTGKVSGEKTVGGLVGETSFTIISNSWSGSDVSGDAIVGGLVGKNRMTSILSNCYATGHVSGRNIIGGLVGECKSEASIENCYATGSVSAEENGGGLVGVHTGTVSECYSTAFVFIDANNAGGLVGDNRGTIRMSCAHGHVSGKNYIGGLVGFNFKYEDPYFNYDPIVTDSYASGSVHGEDFVGGLIGQNRGSTVLRCYSTAKVTGATANSWTGGLISVNGGGPVTNSFWDIEASGLTRSDGGAGKTTSEMQNIWMYLSAGWDFVDETANGSEDIWWIIEGQDYPRLWWQYGQAFAPHPVDGATDVVQPLLLNWAPGGAALSYDVYFGQDAESVADATIESPDTYRGRQAPEITSYDPGNLRFAETYYWRIDEVNEADPNNTWKGCVWSFTTADYIIVDDFESYRDHDKKVWYSWHDGLGYGGPGFELYYAGNGTGSAVGDETLAGGSHMETLIVHGGWQSMPYSYDNNKPGFLKYSEATLSLDYPRNWTEGGVEVLSLWFCGDPNNAPEPMYMGVANTNGPAVVVYHDNPDAALIESWTEWTIDLQGIADQGVNLADVDSITIGFGDRNNPQSGGSGRMFFDDIRLCQLLP